MRRSQRNVITGTRRTSFGGCLGERLGKTCNLSATRIVFVTYLTIGLACGM